MALKLNLVLFMTASVLGLVLFSAEGGTGSGGQFAQNILPDKVINITGSVLATLQDDWNLADKITEAKELLEQSPPLKFEEGRRGLVRKEISLAILDTETGRVFEKRYWLSMTEINKASELRKKYQSNSDNLPRFVSDDPNEDFHVVNNWWNSFNSDWSIAVNGKIESRYVVVADKYLMVNEDLAYPEDRTGQKYSDIVYIPYSPALKDKTLIMAGKMFMDEHVSDAFMQLTQAKVISRSYPGRLVTDTITETFVKNIFLTEHTDPKMMLLSSDGGMELVERVFIRLGTNGEKAFRYTVSKTGASGLGQIMPGTYNSIVRAYPAANLLKNTDIGRVDITNAIKASVLVFDDHLAVVVNRANATARSQQIFQAKSPNEVDEIRAAIYNGGSTKYMHLTGNISTAVTETVLFVRKFRMIRALNLF